MVNDLTAVSPELADEWDTEKNGSLFPYDVTPGSHKKVWWKCKNGHSWLAGIHNRAYGGQGCPYCSGRMVLRGVNDLATVNPELSGEWDAEKNGSLSPGDVAPGSHKKIWWKCKSGHRWQSSVNNRRKGNGCPYCSGRRATKGVNDLAAIFPELALEWDYDKNCGLSPDEMTPKSSRKVWWKCKSGHSWRTAISNRSNLNSGCPFCSGRRAIQGEDDLATVNPLLAAQWDYNRNTDITPDMVKAMSSSRRFWWNCRYGHSWQATVAQRTQGSACPYCSGLIVIQGINDLATMNPMLAADWDDEKNCDLRPENVKSNSSVKVWWRCSKGHSWQAVIYSRNAGHGCPYCANQAILPGYNDFASQRPEIVTEWDFEKNHMIKPDEVALYSSKIVWWHCKYGHSWQAAIRSRSSGSGCPVCAGKLIISGINDLATRFPDIAAQWDKKKNGVLSPDCVAPYSCHKVWWRCKHEHSWQAIVQSRSSGNGCPYCSGQAVLAGYNDLASKKTALTGEWDFDKNGALTPEMVTPSSGRVVWWRCILGHSWQTSIAHRHRGSSCPYCSGRKVLKGFNDIYSTHPHIAAEWDFDKNGTAKPEDFYIGSSMRAWWKCDKGHSWNARIRTRMKYGCPYCAGQAILEGFNDLATLNPSLANQWDCTKNGNLHPKDVSANSGKKVWWRCDQGHQWMAVIASRNNGNGCPYCANKAVLSGYNDLKTLSPELLKEWDDEKNTSVSPDSITLFSHRRVWWKCSRGHSWCAAVSERSSGNGCPVCVGKRSLRPRLVR